jgi:hypothetical protein
VHNRTILNVRECARVRAAKRRHLLPQQRELPPGARRPLAHIQHLASGGEQVALGRSESRPRRILGGPV